MTEQVELVVVGAGPAGLRAAIAAGQAGVSVVVVDGSSGPGGQYFGQLPPAFLADDAISRWPHQAAARSLFEQLEVLGVRVLSNTLVWGAFASSNGAGVSAEPTCRTEPTWQLALYGPGAPALLTARTLILAPGAYDRPIPFPGWTLPGVLTAGAAQTLLKRQRVLPGRRVLLSGAGPLQIAAAAALVHAGADVAGVLEGASLGATTLRHVALWGQWSRVREGWGYWRTLRSARVPYRIGWSVVEVRGDGEVQEAVIARLDSAWRPIPGTEETVAVDTVVIGYGLTPATELSRLLGCSHEYRPQAGGYVPRRDDSMQTSLPGVYVAGDGAGIGGAELAGIEGEIAAIAAAHRLGHLTEDAASTRIARLQPKLAREQNFARMLGRVFTPRSGIYTLARDDTIICRCEEVTLGDIRAAVADGVRSVNELKGLTRIGMGNCQGRICGELAARLMACEAARLAGGPRGGLGEDDPKSTEMAGQFTVRPPIHPLTLSVLARQGCPGAPGLPGDGEPQIETNGAPRA